MWLLRLLWDILTMPWGPPPVYVVKVAPLSYDLQKAEAAGATPAMIADTIELTRRTP